MSERIKMILDCDTGHDDAIALMLAASNPKIDLLGVTVVAGNQVLKKTLVNTLNVCQRLGLDVPVYSGMPLPMVREQVVARTIHGETGLDGPVFGELHLKPQPQNAVDYLIETFRNSDGDITLVPTGPLTNVAVALRMAPDIAPKIKRIVLMGGAYGIGNITPAAEFNIYADPEAASVVFRSGIPITMMGLDLTNQTICTMDIIERMEAIGNEAGKLFGEIMRFTYVTQKKYNDLDGGPVHDVTCVAWLIDPSIFYTKDMFVEVDIEHGPSYGRTVCDYIGNTGKTPNATVGTGLDLPRFWDMLEASLRSMK